MPKNNSAQRKNQRRAAAKHRAATYDMKYGPVVTDQATGLRIRQNLPSSAKENRT